MRHPCRRSGGKRPVSRPALCKWLKAEFGYDDRKGVGACDRGPSGLRRRATRLNHASTCEAEHRVFPRLLTSMQSIVSPFLTSPSFLAQNFALTQVNPSDEVVYQTRLKRCFHQRGGTQDVFRRPCDKDVALAGYPALLHKTA